MNDYALVPLTPSWDLTAAEWNNRLGLFHGLPNELLEKIATFLLSIGNLSQLSLCSKSWNLIVNGEGVWKSFCLRDLNIAVKKTEEMWKQCYRRQIEMPFSVVICGDGNDFQLDNVHLNNPRFSGLDLKRLIISKRPSLKVEEIVLIHFQDKGEIKDTDLLKSKGVQAGDSITLINLHMHVYYMG